MSGIDIPKDLLDRAPEITVDGVVLTPGGKEENDPDDQRLHLDSHNFLDIKRAAHKLGPGN